MRRSRRLLALPAAILATAALATSAFAMTQERHIHEIHVDDVIPAEACGFPIAVHLDGTIRETKYFNADGAWVKAIESAINFKETWTNTLTGASAWTVHTATAHLTLNEDGSAQLAITGVQGRVKSPDGGFIADIGRMVFSIPADGSEPAVEYTGQADGQGGPFPELCDALAG